MKRKRTVAIIDADAEGGTRCVFTRVRCGPQKLCVRIRPGEQVAIEVVVDRPDKEPEKAAKEPEAT